MYLTQHWLPRPRNLGPKAPTPPRRIGRKGQTNHGLRWIRPGGQWGAARHSDWVVEWLPVASISCCGPHTHTCGVYIRKELLQPVYDSSVQKATESNKVGNRRTGE